MSEHASQAFNTYTTARDCTNSEHLPCNHNVVTIRIHMHIRIRKIIEKESVSYPYLQKITDIRKYLFSDIYPRTSGRCYFFVCADKIIG